MHLAYKQSYNAIIKNSRGNLHESYIINFKNIFNNYCISIFTCLLFI